MPGLAVAELRRGSGLHDVVDPGAAAADVLLRRLEPLEARDRVEHRARRARRRPAHGEDGTNPGTRRAAAAASAPPAAPQQLGDVDDVRHAVILQMRAAARGVRDDVVVARELALERTRARDALLEPPAVRMQRTAAALRARHVHVEALGVQHARRRRVDVAEDDARDAAGEHGDARPVAGQVLGRPLGRRPRRRDLLQRRERPRRRQLAERATPPAAAAGAGTPRTRPPARAASSTPRRWFRST